MVTSEKRHLHRIVYRVVQSEPDGLCRESRLREVMANLMDQAVILPLFHYHYQISAPPGIHGITINARGWFDFTRAWLPPPGMELQAATR